MDLRNYETGDPGRRPRPSTSSPTLADALDGRRWLIRHRSRARDGLAVRTAGVRVGDSGPFECYPLRHCTTRGGSAPREHRSRPICQGGSAASVTWRLDTDTRQHGAPLGARRARRPQRARSSAGQVGRVPAGPARASPRSTRPSAAACAPASCCSSAARRAPARPRWPSRWRATSPRAARPTSSTSASSTTSRTCSTA